MRTPETRRAYLADHNGFECYVDYYYEKTPGFIAETSNPHSYVQCECMIDIVDVVIDINGNAVSIWPFIRKGNMYYDIMDVLMKNEEIVNYYK